MKFIINDKESKIQFLIDKEIFASGSLYYYAIDDIVDPKKDSTEKVVNIVTKMLKEWKRIIARLKIQDRVAFAFILEDEYVGFLEFDILINEKMMIRYFISTEEFGYLYSPSTIGTYKSEDFGGVIGINDVEVSREDFLRTDLLIV